MSPNFKCWCLIAAIGAAHLPNLASAGDFRLPFVPRAPAARVGTESVNVDDDVGGLAPELEALRRAPADSRLIRVTFSQQAIIKTKSENELATFSAPGAKGKPTEANDFDADNETHVDNLVISYKGELPADLLKRAGLAVAADDKQENGNGRKRLLLTPTKEIGQQTAEILSQAVRKGEILAAEPEYKVYSLPPETVRNAKEVTLNAIGVKASAAANVPNDPGYGQLYGLKKINAEAAWNRTKGGKIVVAVIDTGVSYRHPDILENMWVNSLERDGTPNVDDDRNGFVDDVHGFDFVRNDADPDDGPIGHGTHCAGTIAAIGNNGRGVVGVCWNAEIMAVRIFGDSGAPASNLQIARAIDYAVRNKAQVINASWGGPMRSLEIEAAIRRANQAGVLFVAAAGNDSQNVDSPATPSFPSGYDIPNIISVGATDANDQRASFSNFGRTKVDIGAPGVNILSLAPGDKYQQMSGTSMATPHVAGAAALFLSAATQEKADGTSKFLFEKSRIVDSLRQSWGSSLTVNRPGSTLNVAAIADIPQSPDSETPTDPPEEVTKAGGAVFTNSFKAERDSETVTHRDLVLINITIEKPSRLLITANTGVRSLSGTTDLTLTVGDKRIKNALKTDPKTMPGWDNSLRSITADEGRWVNIGTHFERAISPGTHTIYLSVYLHDKNSRLQFDNGTLSVTVIGAEK